MYVVMVNFMTSELVIEVAPAHVKSVPIAFYEELPW
jgi:hypothetical protein